MKTKKTWSLSHWKTRSSSSTPKSGFTLCKSTNEKLLSSSYLAKLSIFLASGHMGLKNSRPDFSSCFWLWVQLPLPKSWQLLFLDLQPDPNQATNPIHVLPQVHTCVLIAAPYGTKFTFLSVRLRLRQSNCSWNAVIVGAIR